MAFGFNSTDQNENIGEMFGSVDQVYAASMNTAMPYSDYDLILQGEADISTAKFKGLSYEKSWFKITKKFWESQEGYHDGMVYVCPELKVLWPLIKKETDTSQASKIINNFLHNNVVEAEEGVKPVSDKVIAVNTDIVYKDPEYEKYWFASTLKGINIRPGIMGLEDGDGHDVDKTEPLHMDDMNPHCLMAGRTGAGKSVALNTIIASLLQEFPPWELEINLADFKIVEMSRYGQTGFEAPHVSKIAATEAMEYVVSVMYDMYEAMSVRQQFFAGVGVQNIKDFREKFGVVLPHVVLIVDEFQQMYELASGKQTDIINQLIKMVTKLGRATGYHLQFASQSMSGTLSADVQSNFKMRICLPAAADTSMAVLGNKASSELKGKGYCFTNCEGGAEDANIKYRVPFLRSETDDKGGLTDLQRILKWNKELADKVGYSRPMNFFRDSSVRPMHQNGSYIRSFSQDIELFRQGVQGAIARNQEIEDILLLGDSYVYKEPKGSNLDVTLEYFNLKIGDRKNILVIGDSPFQRAYLTELLAMQYAIRGENNSNVVVNADTVMSDVYDINETLMSSGSVKPDDVAHKDFIAHFTNKYQTRVIINEYVQYCNIEDKKDDIRRAKSTDKDRKLLELILNTKFSSENFEKFMQNDPDDISKDRPMSAVNFGMRYTDYIVNAAEMKEYDGLSASEERYVDSLVDDEVRNPDSEVTEETRQACREEVCKDALNAKNNMLFKGVSAIKSVYTAIKNMYLSGVKNGKFSFKNIPTLTYWVLGFNNIGSIAGEKNQASKIENAMRNCTNFGIRMVFVGSMAKDIPELLKTFGYLFIQSANDMNYSKFDMTMSKEIKDNVIRFKAVNDVLSNVKPNLYPLPNDEKMFKMFDRDYTDKNDDDFFRCF